MQPIQTWLKTQLKPTHSSSSKNIQQEYTTRIITLTLVVMMIFTSPVLIVGWLIGKYPVDMAIISTIAAGTFILSWEITKKGYWHISRYLPIIFTYIIALYYSFTYGSGSVNALFFVAVIFFSASLLGDRKIWLFSFLSLITFLTTEYAIRNKYIIISPQTTNFTGFVTINIILFTGLTILISRFTSQYQQSLISAEDYALELETHKQSLESTVAERTAELENSLAEKEILLKEIHHRVKNNLQIVAGLLYLQARQSDSPDVRAPLEESHTRVKSMAMVHEMLYQSPNLGQIDFSDYARKLTNFITQTYRKPHITVNFKMESTIIPIDSAITAGLILNELVTNVYKYAFQNGDTGTLTIGLNNDTAGKHHFIVADTGRGFSKAQQLQIKNVGLDNFNRQTSLGLQLVGQLTRQLQGEITLSHLSGTTFEIIF